MSAHLPQILIEAVQHGILNKYFIIASIAIMLYDYVLMLPAEIEHIWKTKFGIGSVLYVLTRYIPFVEAPFLILYAFNVGYGHSPNAETLCLRAYTVAAWLDVWGTLVANNVLYLRTAAIWGWTKPTLACVAVANMFFVPLTVYHMDITLRYMKCRASLEIPVLFAHKRVTS